jgi:hypothetical protein
MTKHLRSGVEEPMVPIPNIGPCKTIAGTHTYVFYVAHKILEELPRMGYIIALGIAPITTRIFSHMLHLLFLYLLYIKLEKMSNI